MKRQWRLILPILLLMLALVVTASCTNQGGQNGGTGSRDETSTGGGDAEIGDVTVMGVWGGTEIEAFNEVVAGWQDETGGTVQFEGTRDLSAILRARVSGGNPPDIAILPNPALLQEFAAAGQLKPLDDMLEMDAIGQDYASTWTDLGTVDGNMYGLFIRASTKSTVWYSPAQFEAAGYAVPKTWDELRSLTASMVADGKAAPWSIGVEAGGASGWPGTDWIQEIYLTESGPDMYDQWVNHEIPWTDPSIKSAWQKFGEMALTEGHVPGGVSSILSTNFQDSTYLPFQEPPRAHMVFLGAFTQGFISAQFPNLEAEADYDFFKFVEIEEPGTVTGGADVLVVFNDNESTRSLVRYLADGGNWESWAQAGGFATPNQGLDPSNYPDELARKAAAQLTDSETFRFDADDLMPAEVQNAYFQGILAYLQNPEQLDSILANIESVAESAYQ